MEDDHKDYEEDENTESLILSIGDDGKAEIHNPKDWVEVKEKDMDLIQGFIKENNDLFKKYCEKHKQ